MIIGIAGGSGSGKTTFTNAIKEMFKEDVLIIRHDDYYKDHSNLSFEEKKHINLFIGYALRKVKNCIFGN